MLSILLLTSALAADLGDPKLPSRFTCVVVRSLYKHYAKKYSQEDMEAYLRAKGVREEKIVSAKKCLNP